MDDHLVITHVVAFGQLDNPIQNHRVAKKFRLDNLQMLILRLFVRKDVFDSHTLAIIRMQFLSKPNTHDIYKEKGIFSTSASRSILRSAKLFAPNVSFRRWINGIISLPIAHVKRSIAQ